MSALGFRVELQKLINRESRENGSNTPDFILTEYLAQCLVAFDLAVQARDRYYGRPFHSFEKPAHSPADVANSREAAAAADGIHQSRPDSAETLGVMDQPAGECAAHETSETNSSTNAPSGANRDVSTGIEP